MIYTNIQLQWQDISIRLGTVLSSLNYPVFRFSKGNYPVPGSGSTVPGETIFGAKKMPGVLINGRNGPKF